MTVSGRLLETGHDAAGGAIVLADREVAPIALAGRAAVAHVFGGRDGIACFPETVCPVAGAGQAAPGGWRCTTLTIAEGGDDAYHRFIADVLGPLADPADPGFHKTPTTDLVYVVAGVLALDLDAGESRRLGPGDVALLSGVRHRWRNAGAGDATLFCVQIGAHHEAPLPAAPPHMEPMR